MSKIPGPILLIAGIFMAVMSKIGVMKEEPMFKIFFFIGLAFALFGLIRTILFYKDKQKSKVQQAAMPIAAKYQHKQPVQHQVQATHASRHPQEKSIVFCTRCGTKNWSHSKFCHICGQPLQMNR